MHQLLCAANLLRIEIIIVQSLVSLITDGSENFAVSDGIKVPHKTVCFKINILG